MYKVIDNLPIDYNFSTKSNKELKLYSKWFDENKQERIKELTELVNSSDAYKDWDANYFPESLKILDSWFRENIETEKMSKEDFEKQRSKVPEWIEISDMDITIKSRSIIVDVGIYLGEVFSKTNNIKWEQYLSRSKNDNNRGHMILNLDKMYFNPIGVTYVLATKIAFPYNKYITNTKSKDDGLYDVYNIYLKYI